MQNQHTLESLHWESYPPKRGKPGYDEAVISEWFDDLTENDFGYELDVTIRRYPQNYFVAYCVTDPDDPGNVYLYTNDGDGDGRIPLKAWTVCMRVFRADFERDFSVYMDTLRKRLTQVIW